MTLVKKIQEYYVNKIEPKIDRVMFPLTLFASGNALLQKGLENTADLSVSELGCYAGAWVVSKLNSKIKSKKIRVSLNTILFFGVPYAFSEDNYLIHALASAGVWTLASGATKLYGSMKKQDTNVEEFLGVGQIKQTTRRAAIKTLFYAGAGSLLTNWVVNDYKTPNSKHIGELVESIETDHFKLDLPEKPTQVSWDDIKYHKRVNEVNLDDVVYAPKESIIGRIQRAARWEALARKAAAKYNLNWESIIGIIMQESYGDPLQENHGNDGGIGLGHLQPRTAKDMGLKIVGTASFNYHDPENGKLIKQLLDKCKGSLPCVAEVDERANPIINIDAIARYLVHYKKVYGDENRAIKAYRGPFSSSRHNYLKQVQTFINYYKNHKDKAINEFNKKNQNTKVEYGGRVKIGLTFDEMIMYHNHNLLNWGADFYDSLPRKNFKGQIID